MMDAIIEEESNLANCLWSVCTPLMDEKKSKLRESTEILCRLGKLYLKKAKITEDMDQKLNFIKAAALLHGARTRSQKFLSNHFETQIHKSLEELQTLLMEKCCGKLSVSLLDISKEVLAAFQLHREEEKKCLDTLEIIKDNFSEDELIERWKRKAEIMKNLLIRNSESYKNQMQNIARYCVKILGHPPLNCDFAIVGLGSLARDEVTLYSDFEHVILLDDMVEVKEEYQKILAYFRWFSVVFHIIVIGIGETLIPSIGVESLNDFYSSEKARNWFYDSFTPSGVSFDGLMPHACKIPIGRQRKTAKKDFTMELIKPVSKMAAYLTKQEDLVNEYNLKDVLSETCFVFGSQKLYALFKEKSNKILSLESDYHTFSSLSEAAGKNRNRHVSGFSGMLGGETVDPKVQFYRPLSVFIGYAAHVQGIKERSGFDKVSQLQGIALSKDTKSLESAFAVACEIRSKMYVANFGNRARMGTDVLEYVGVQCLVNCSSAIADFCLYFKALSHAEEFQKFLGAKLTVFMFLEKYSEAKKEIVRIINQVNFLGSFTHLIVLHKQILARIYIIEAKAFPESKEDLLQAAEKVLLEVDGCHGYYKICLLLSNIYYHQKSFNKAMDLANTAIEKIRKGEYTLGEMLEAQSILIQATKCCMNASDFVNYCIDFLTKNRDIVTKLKFGFAIAEAKCEIDEKDEARLIFKRLMELWTSEAVNVLPLNMCRQGVKSITVKQGSEGWLDDCVQSYDMLDDILRPARDSVDHELLMHHRAEACLKASAGKSKNMSEKFQLCEKTTEICQDYATQDMFHTMHCFAISAIFEYNVSCNIQDFDPLRLYTMLKKAPCQVQNSIDVKATTGRCMIKSFARLHQSKEISTKELLCKIDHCWRIVDSPHPFVYPFLRDLLVKIYLQLHEMFGRPLDLDGILNYYRTQDFAKSTNNLWKSLFGKNALPRRDACKLVNHIYRLICVKAYLDFHDKVDILPHELSSDPDFVKSVYSYFKYDFELAITEFWKIIHREMMNSYLQRLSITFLCNTIIQFLPEKRNFSIYHDYFKQQLSAGPSDVVKILEHSQSNNIHETQMAKRLLDLPGRVSNDIATHDRERFS